MIYKAVGEKEEMRKAATVLRRKSLSYLEISRHLSIPKSTIAGWFKGEKWSQEIAKKLASKQRGIQADRIRLMSVANKKRFEKIRESYRQKAKEEFSGLFDKKLFIASLMLYAGEGDLQNANSNVRIANTNWRMLKVFKRFLLDVCGVPKEKIRCAIVLYPDLDEGVCKTFWSKVLGIKFEQFHKTQFIKGKHPTNRLKNGIGYVIVSSRELKEKILVWIDLCYKNL